MARVGFSLWHCSEWTVHVHLLPRSLERLLPLFKTKDQPHRLPVILNLFSYFFHFPLELEWISNVSNPGSEHGLGSSPQTQEYTPPHQGSVCDPAEDILTSLPGRKDQVSVCVSGAGESRDTPLMSVEWPKERCLPRVPCHVVCALVLINDKLIYLMLSLITTPQDNFHNCP